jgi:ubiquinone/menaquinone biosynthesis C-methylase UbiE
MTTEGSEPARELLIRNREGLSRSYSDETWRVYELLDKSLDPRGPDSLYDIAGEYLVPGSRILDAGCRDAAHLIRLVQRYGGSGVGIDPVDIHIERARERVEEARLAEEITLSLGVMQQVPYADGYFDFIWCRDVVEQVDNLNAALREAARVLSPRGHMLVYTVFATDLMSEKEVEMMNRALADVPANLVERNVEEAFVEAGFVIERKDVIGSEWREHDEERTKPVSHSLLQLSRLRRQRAELVEQVGLDIYEHVEAHLHWLVFMFLGKVLPTIYILRRRDG